MKVRGVAGMALAVALGVGGVGLGRAEAQAANQPELTAIRVKLDEIATLLKQFVQQSTRQDRAVLLSQRLETAERRLIALEDRLQRRATERDHAQGEAAQARNSLQALAEMAKLDPSGSAADALQKENVRLQSDLDRRTTDAQRLAGEVTDLEALVAQRRAQVAQLESALDQLLIAR
ncbi:MAG: hypothetical protein ABIT71_18645 [Vicinamibacteraceae bacterium]